MNGAERHKGVTAARMKALDQAAIREFGIPALVMMENAGRGAAEIVDRFAHENGLGGCRTAVVCGRGNNGGDGFVIARHLQNRGYGVRVFFDGDPMNQADLSDETRTNLAIVRKMNIPLGGCDEVEAELAGFPLIVDALLGVGLTGKVRPRERRIIDAMNGQEAARIAVDVPSGLDCDSGKPLGCAVAANVTVTFGLPKIGFFLNDGPAHVGTLHVADIGLPLELIERLK